jgi:protocatechuate 3,4-dioxygenase beta subunit
MPTNNNTSCAAVSGLQVGQVTFTTIYPGWYAGRATHIHVDVYRSGAIVKTLQVGISL